MLDTQLAALYGVKPRRLREQVRRNMDRFPEDFMFQLTAEEADTFEAFLWRTPALGIHSGRDCNALERPQKSARDPRERWRSVALAKLEELEHKFLGHDGDIERIFETLRDLMDPPEGPRRRIGFRTEQP